MFKILARSWVAHMWAPEWLTNYAEELTLRELIEFELNIHNEESTANAIAQCAVLLEKIFDKMSDKE